MEYGVLSSAGWDTRIRFQLLGKSTWIRIGDGPTGGMSATFVSGSHFCAIPPDLGSFGDMYGKK